MPDTSPEALQGDFNSRAHVERDYPKYIILYFFANFNSRAHVERDDVTRHNLKSGSISTHALTWSATV